MKKNYPLTDDEFKEQREAVLGTWPTGKGIDLEEAVAYLKSQPEQINAVKVLQKARATRETLICGRAGVATLEGQIELLKCLKETGSMDILPITTDSLTRNNLYEKCDQGIRESLEKKVNALNGFPVVNHGVKGGRQLLEQLMAPIVLRVVGLDVRLAVEIGLASGFTASATAETTCFATYSKHETYEQIFNNYRYIDRLYRYYEEKGIPIYREYHSLNMRAVLIPPSLYNAVQVIQSLTMAAQGSKYLGPCSPIQGHLLQDMAAVRSQVKMVEEYLKKFGHQDVTVFTVLNPWAGAYPVDEGQVYTLLSFSAAVASLVGAQLVLSKSIDEALRVPKKENNAAGSRAMKLMLKLMRGVTWPETPELLAEEQEIDMETRLIVDKVLEMGEGDPAAGLSKALESGAVDIPFSPNINVKDKVIPLRDHTRAVRYYDSGYLPFNESVKKFNREKLSLRFAQAPGKSEYDLLVEDVMGGLSLNSMQALMH